MKDQFRLSVFEISLRSPAPFAPYEPPDEPGVALIEFGEIPGYTETVMADEMTIFGNGVRVAVWWSLDLF